MFEELASKTRQVTADDFETRQDSMWVLRRIDGDQLSDSIPVKLIEITRGRTLMDRESYSLLFETEVTGIRSNLYCVLILEGDPWITIGLCPIVHPHGEQGKTYLEAVFT